MRSKTLPLLLVVLFALTPLVAAAHWQQQQVFRQSQQHWQNVNDELWQSQPDRHPHRVAHYGSMVFRQPSPLAFMDAGVNPSVGNALYLEAHRQNGAALPQFSFSARHLHLGYISVATLVLVLLPLMLVAAGYNSISDERSSGRWRLLASLGVKPWQMLLGKGLAYYALVAIYLLALVLAAALFIAQTGFAGTGSVWLLLSAIIAVYALYCCVWLAVILSVSALCKSAAQSLFWLLGLWFAWVVILPKMLPLIAEQVYATPTRAAFEATASEALRQVGDAHNPNDPHFSAFKQAILQKYGVEDVAQLPVNWNGLRMAEGERLTSEVFQQQYALLQQRYQQQNQLLQWAGLLSPYLLTSGLSQRLAQSDSRVFTDFEQQAEAYRFALIQELNHLHTTAVAHEDDKMQRISHEHWQQLPMFSYQQPSAARTLRSTALPLLGYSWWLGLAALLGLWVSRKRGWL